LDTLNKEKRRIDLMQKRLVF